MFIYILLIILSLLAALLMIGVVLIQKSKGGGLSSSFAGTNQIMGVRRTNNFIEKVTWTLAGCIAVFAILSTFFIPNSVGNTAPRVKAPAAVEQSVAGYDSQLPAASEAPAAAPAETPAEAPAEAPAAEAPAAE